MSDNVDSKNHRVMFIRGIVGKVVGLMRNFVLLPFLTPAEYGTFQWAMALAAYVSMGHLGTLWLLPLKLPAAFANDDDDAIVALVGTAKWVIALGAVLGALVVYGAMLWRGIVGFEAVVFALLTMTTCPARLGNVICKSQGAFVKAASAEATASLVGMVAMLVAMYAFGLPGLLCLALVGPSIEVLHYRRFLMLRRRWVFRMALLREGLAVWWTTFLANQLPKIEVFVLGSTVGLTQTDFGCYAIALAVTMTIQQLSAAFKAVDSVRIAADFDGENDDKPLLFVRQTARDMLFGVVLSLPMLPAFMVLVEVFLPKYASAVPLVAVHVVLSPLRRLFSFPHQIALLRAHRRFVNWLCAVVSVVAAVTLWAACAHGVSSTLICVVIPVLTGGFGAVLLLAEVEDIERHQAWGLLAALLPLGVGGVVLGVVPMSIWTCLAVALLSSTVAGLWIALTFRGVLRQIFDVMVPKRLQRMVLKRERAAVGPDQPDDDI